MGIHRPSIINIYAVEDTVTKTHDDHVTRQGFGYSSPLAQPQITNETFYRWQGRLQPNAAEQTTNPQGVESSNSRSSIEELAENFAQNYRDRQDPVLQKKGDTSYSLQFQPTQAQLTELMKTNAEVARVIRALNPDEQRRFMEAFHEANKASVQKK